MKKYIFTLLSLFFLLGISSCIKDHPDAPPENGNDPTDITATSSIADIKALSPITYQKTTTPITQNLIISVVVVGDDKSGNLYKQLVVEDSTGGIMLLLSGSYLYANYPIGRRLFIKLQGLLLINNYGTYEIAAYIDPNNNPQGIPSDLFSRYIVAGKWGISVAPKLVTLSQLPSNALQNELIQIDNVQVKSNELYKTYANGTSLKSGSIAIESCTGNTADADTAVIYTSGYADFASTHAPPGNGTIVVIYSSDYYNVPQFTVRDTEDIQLYGPRPCD